ncbi:hypothetical protein SAMN05443252_102162 [Bacillus sp. OV322]|nr:hypothetical protein [Bacillus sp. OV322]SFC19916.1 hypothetical protein SAMN05443252_102162 [Bacillus sp. OV322]
MEILIKDFASNCSLNYFEVSLIEQSNEVSSIKPIKPLNFLEVIFKGFS